MGLRRLRPSSIVIPIGVIPDGAQPLMFVIPDGAYSTRNRPPLTIQTRYQECSQTGHPFRFQTCLR